MPDELIAGESSDALVPTVLNRIDLATLEATSAERGEFDHWWPTVLLLRRLGATEARRMGNGLGIRFGRFWLETQVYPTRGVAAIGHKSFFKLSSAVSEPNSFSVMLYNGATTGRDLLMLGVGFGPLPEKDGAVDGVELARRYVVALSGVFEGNPKLLQGDTKALAQALGLLQG